MIAELDWTTGGDVILVRECERCGHRCYLPRARCPACFAGPLTARPARGGGVAVAVTVLSPADGTGAGRGICLVDLDEGIRVMASCEPDLQPGDRVLVDVLAAVPAASAHVPLAPSPRKAP